MKRPAIRWHGGKWRLAPWIIEHMPPHTVYVEPFAGAASVLLRKPRVPFEVYNDLDQEVYNVFRVLRDPAKAEELTRLCYFTPFGRMDFLSTYCDEDYLAPIDAAEDVARAHRQLVRAAMGFGSDAPTRRARNGFRAKVSSHGSPAMAWARWPDHIRSYVDRLRGVILECKPATDVIRHFDSPRTLFYIDPPYVHSTRSGMKHRNRKGHGYRHELDDEAHVALLEQLSAVQGIVVLSGYSCELYCERLAGWCQFARSHSIEHSAHRTECLWINRPASGLFN